VTKLDPIWNRARADLLISTPKDEVDVFLWEYSTRIARTAQQIIDLPEVRSKRVDEGALVAAALYHDAAWVVHIREQRATAWDVGGRSRCERHREIGAAIMEQRLADLLSPESLHRASQSIRTLDGRSIELIEGQILNEAKTLDEFGAVALWPLIRKGTIEGKGVEAAIEGWRRQKEYHYWTALIKDSFRFETVRQVAMQRLALMERFMNELEVQHTGGDLTI
jgi:hypothetical protein